MPKFSTGIVSRILESREGIERVNVKLGRRTRPALNFPEMTGAVKKGDRVVVNTTAVDLDLGTGGDDFVVWNLENAKAGTMSGGHILKVRYTPWQLDRVVAEAPEGDHHDAIKEASSLAGMPVVACGLHSQVAPVVAMLKHFDPDLTVVYVMTDGGALPLAYSSLLAELADKNLIEATITAGHAFGGDLECVNIYSALVAAADALNADVAVASVGPGVVGTQTLLGHTGMEQGQIMSATSALGGRAVAALRISFADPRPRHHGVSSHSLAALRYGALGRSTIAVPDLELDKLNSVMKSLIREGLTEMHDVRILDAWETEIALKEFELEPTSMGRSMAEDPDFFEAAGAAGLLAARLIYDIED